MNKTGKYRAHPCDKKPVKITSAVLLNWLKNINQKNFSGNPNPGTHFHQLRWQNTLVPFLDCQ